MNERCHRCGSAGSDRRTLWMACFYAMHELGIPFEYADVDGRNFYTLRVCKRCRADWMDAIQAWFRAKPCGEDHDADEPEPSAVQTGIFVRVNGAIREVTMEEWERMREGQS